MCNDFKRTIKVRKWAGAKLKTSANLYFFVNFDPECY